VSSDLLDYINGNSTKVVSLLYLPNQIRVTQEEMIAKKDTSEWNKKKMQRNLTYWNQV
jgi:hypothetical protein